MTNSKISPSDINSVWSSSAALFDPIVAHDGAKLIVSPLEEQIQSIRDVLSRGYLVLEDCPDFFSHYDYDWVFNELSWQRGDEAAFQIRALQQLTSLWCKKQEWESWKFDKIVLRYSWDTFTSNPSPQCKSIGQYDFIIMPFSFLETSTLLIHSFIDNFLDEEETDSWKELFSSDQIENHSSFSISPCLRQTILRVATSEIFNPFVSESLFENAKRRIPWFYEARGINESIYNASIPEQQILYSLVDFSIAHELSHALLKHNSSASGEAAIYRELQADYLGLRLYFSSWGWRDEILEGCPISQIARQLIGPITSIWFSEWINSCTRMYQMKTYPQLSNSRKDELIEEAKNRENRHQAILNTLDGYLQYVKKIGGSFSEEDLSKIINIIKKMQYFNEFIQSTIFDIPDQDLYELKQYIEEQRQLGAFG